MGLDRRKFLKVAGVAALGIAGGAPAKLRGQTSPALTTETPPLTAKRWAMVIDLNKCHQAEGCQDCVNACNAAHNVPEFPNKKDEIKWIWKEPYDHAFIDQEQEYEKESLKEGPVLLLCNHCDNPPCVRVCPTQATWRREEDGIVMMDWHRCIGCRYCMAACPYGSRSFNWRDPRPFIENINDEFPTRTRGVVEKCTFCDERLAKGMLPACVEACKEKALVFGDLEDPDSEVREILGKNFTIRRKPGLGTRPEVYYLV
ncbi:MAG: 4Fe-4S dicluster domain-containing protein [bacterium]